MKKMTLKSKITTGVIAASLLSTTAFAYANTNAGAQFTTWGQAQINAAKAAVQSALAGSLSTAQTNINSQANSDRDTAKGNIDAAGTAEKDDTKSKIEGKLAEHIASLQAALAAFMSTIGADFDTFVAAQNGNTTASLNSQYATLSANITSVLTAAKNTNVTDVTEQSLLVKGQATSDLIKEINRVKAALAAEVQSQQTTAQNEVNTYLTNEVNRINGLLDTLISGLETDAKNAITAAGQSVEDSAIANFERVISRIGVETPLAIDPQKLRWIRGQIGDGKVSFRVENSNEFDVVFRYKFKATVGGGQTGGVTETPYAQNTAQPGTTSFTFNAPFAGGELEVEWLDHNGVWQDADVRGVF